MILKNKIKQWLTKSELDFLNDWVDILLPFVKVLLLILLGFIFWKLLKKFSHRVAHYFLNKSVDLDREKRNRTFIRLSNNLGLAVIFAFVFLESLAEFGYSIAPLLATAGIAGFAIAFGMQNIVKDIASGFLLLFDGQIREGDVVEISGKKGTVEEIKLRFIQMRDAAGVVHYLPNGSIGAISNYTKYYSYVVIDLLVDCKEPYEKVEQCIHEAYQLTQSDSKYRLFIIDRLEILGIENLERSSMTVRFRIKVQAHQAAALRREILFQIKRRLEFYGISLASAAT